MNPKGAPLHEMLVGGNVGGMYYRDFADYRTTIVPANICIATVGGDGALLARGTHALAQKKVAPKGHSSCGVTPRCSRRLFAI